MRKGLEINDEFAFSRHFHWDKGAFEVIHFLISDLNVCEFFRNLTFLGKEYQTSAPATTKLFFNNDRFVFGIIKNDVSSEVFSIKEVWQIFWFFWSPDIVYR